MAIVEHDRIFLYECDRITIAVPFRKLYPECGVLIADSPKLHALMCLRDQCHKNQRCVERVTPRIKRLFHDFPHAKWLLLYFTFPHRKSVGAAMFSRNWNDARYPCLLRYPWGPGTDDPVVNRYGWEQFKARCVVNTWTPPPELFDNAPLPIQIRNPHESAQVIAPKGLVALC